MKDLFDAALARADRATAKRHEFARAWSDYIDTHPWDIDVRLVGPCTLEILTRTRRTAPLELSLIFSEWLATTRASLDNGLYAWVAAATGANPPLHADRVQYSICSSRTGFNKQVKRRGSSPTRHR